MPPRIFISTYGDRLQHTIGMTPTLAIPYIRFSHSGQESGSSRDRQREIISENITRMGWTALPPVEDLGKSAYHGDHLRSELGKLTDRVVAGDFAPGTVVCAEKIDRLSRQGYDALTDWMKTIIRAGLVIYTCDDGKIYDAGNISRGLDSMMGRMMKAEAAREYVDNMVGRVITGIRARQAKSAALGRPTCLRKEQFGVIPGFFAWEGDVLVIVHERAEIIRDMYRWSAQGLGAGSIARRLNEQGRLAWGHGKARFWQPSSVDKYLKSPAVEGDFIPTVNGQPGERIVGYYFGLRAVDADLVKLAREAAARRSAMKGAGPSADFVNIFQGRTKCGGCTGRMHVQKCKDGKGVIRRYFRCDRAARRAGCERTEMYPYEVFETAMLDQMLHLALDDRFFSRPANVRPFAEEVAHLEKLLGELRAKTKRLTKLIVSTDDPDPAWLEEQGELRGVISSTESRLEAARKALAGANGTVPPEAHLHRVLEVREAMRSPDRTTALAAARSVRDAMAGVVDLIISDLGPNGEKSMLVFMAGCLITYRVSNADGSVTNYQDRIARALRGQPSLRLFNAASSCHPDGAERLAALVRRMAA